MSETSGAREQRPVANVRSHVAVLIGAERDRAIAAEVLKAHGLRVRAFARTAQVFRRAAPTDVVLSVLCVHENLASAHAEIESLTHRIAGAPHVVLCSSVERRDVRAALAAGAAGVLTCEEVGHLLMPCLAAVLSGYAFVPRSHWREIEPPPLSTREKQILGMVVMGYMNAQIAERLFLAESTVKSHLTSAFAKLGVRSRNEAVDLILNPDSGLELGILRVGGDPIRPQAAVAR